MVALHFETPEGRVIVTMAERGFITGARTEKDFHGHPFRTIAQLDAELRCDGPVPLTTETRGGAFRGPDLALMEKLKAAWELFVSGAALTCQQAAEMGGVNYPTLTQYIRQNHEDEARTLRRQRRDEAQLARKEKAKL